ncbi:MAG: gluconolaconase [Caulobacteraceae bacterium]|nr:gluconolaconase [Caulobacteraceae bacterium]
MMQKVSPAPQSILSVHATLGEGPVWIEADQALWFVDIKACFIHRYAPIDGQRRRWEAPSQPGWVLPATGGALIAGLQSGLHRFDPADGSFQLLHAPEAHLPGNRLNDAATDPAGRIWFGSMDDAEKAPSGQVYRYSQGECVDSGLPGAIVTNGPAISPDGRRLYPVDSVGKTIFEVDIDADGALGPPRPFAVIEDGAGFPDGPVCDAEGCIWVGLWGGWGVRRYDPDGRLMQVVEFPVENVTKIAFGGPDLDIAYATTARKGLSASALAQQPLAGNLFAFDPGVKGVAVTPARV